MKEHAHRYVVVIEKHALKGANKNTFTKHSHCYMTLVKSTCAYMAPTRLLKLVALLHSATSTSESTD